MRPNVLNWIKKQTNARIIDSGEDGFAVQINALRIIASWGMGWEHVSVSTERRCPLWDEMCYIKSLFWRDDESVVQFHPSRDRYVNNHPYCLHLWRPTEETFPMPPTYMVGVLGVTQ